MSQSWRTVLTPSAWSSERGSSRPRARRSNFRSGTRRDRRGDTQHGPVWCHLSSGMFQIPSRDKELLQGSCWGAPGVRCDKTVKKWSEILTPSHPLLITGQHTTTLVHGWLTQRIWQTPTLWSSSSETKVILRHRGMSPTRRPSNLPMRMDWCSWRPGRILKKHSIRSNIIETLSVRRLGRMLRMHFWRLQRKFTKISKMEVLI